MPLAYRGKSNCLPLRSCPPFPWRATFPQTVSQLYLHCTFGQGLAAVPARYDNLVGTSLGDTTSLPIFLVFRSRSFNSKVTEIIHAVLF
jgi:hypothetical protein